MKYLLLFFMMVLSTQTHALKIMTFNTMCDFCNGSNFFEFDKRSKNIQKIIEADNLDIIALQEVRSFAQIKQLASGLSDYQIVSNNEGIISYADPTIIIKNSYKILEKGQFWLGPNKGAFTFGWKLALPRQVLWVKLKKGGSIFYFATSHFDNRIENLAGSAEMLRQFFQEKKYPVIFAADTNLTKKMDSYKTLLGDFFENTFDLKESFRIEGKKTKERDLCYRRKGKKFPSCKVDHILVSKNAPFKIKEFKVNLTRFEGSFPSDHRPITVTFQVLKQLP
jgi:endonuclease/exonuclease/phosphatase family metal-dependent hydrolase